MKKHAKAAKVTAGDAYQLAQCQAVAKIVTLREMLLAHHSQAHRAGVNFAHVGDLNHLGELLDEALAFLVKEV